MQNDGKNRKFKLQKVEGAPNLRMVIKKIDKLILLHGQEEYKILGQGRTVDSRG